MVWKFNQDGRLTHRNFGEFLKYGNHTVPNLQRKKKKTRESQNPVLEKVT